VKFRNSTEPLPNVTFGTPSNLSALYICRVFLLDESVWEATLSFSLLNVSFDANVCSVGGLNVNGIVSNVNRVVLWNNEMVGFYYQVFVELWRYNVTTSSFGFDSRFVSLWLNVTASS
jgi:hypothetical protein